MTNRQAIGKAAYHAGEAAEHIVARDYENRGYSLVRRRWRGAGGEIDLIMRDRDNIIFVEVKKARDFHTAAERISHRQIDRICAGAAEFLAGEPAGQMTGARFDVALVDQTGRFRILGNAFGQG